MSTATNSATTTSIVEEQPTAVDDSSTTASTTNYQPVHETKDNLLQLFSSANSPWSQYYSVDILVKEAEERQKNSTPLLSNNLKAKLAERKAKMKSLKIELSGNNNPAATTAVTLTTTTTSLNASSSFINNHVATASSSSASTSNNGQKSDANMSEKFPIVPSKNNTTILNQPTTIVIAESSDEEDFAPTSKNTSATAAVVNDYVDNDLVVEISSDDDNEDDEAAANNQNVHHPQKDDDISINDPLQIPHEEEDADDSEEPWVQQVSKSSKSPSQNQQQQQNKQKKQQGQDEFGEEFVSIRGEDDDNDMILRRIVSTVPWITKEYQGPKALRLHEELIEFYNFVKQTPSEHAQRESVIKQVEDICKEVDPTCTVELFGSYPSELMIPGSDLDVQVTSELDAKNFLTKVHDAVKRKRFASKIEKVLSARVPIVKFVESSTGQNIDISCNTKNNVSLAVQTVRKFSQTFPQFKYLALFLKYFLRQRGLNEVFSGGLSSFGLSLMIISHLQMHSCNTNASDAQISTLGTLLLDFFALYGLYFNYKSVGIDVRRGGTYVANPNDGKKNQMLQLYVIDPNDFTNNVTKGTANVAGIRHAFQHAFSSLTADESQFTGDQKNMSLLSRIIRVTRDDLKRRVYIHQDTTFKQYCLTRGVMVDDPRRRHHYNNYNNNNGSSSNINHANGYNKHNQNSRKNAKRRRDGRSDNRGNKKQKR